MLSSNEFTTPTKTRYQAESTKFSSDTPNNISLTSSSSTPSKEICFAGSSYLEDKSKFNQSRHQHERSRIANERFPQTDVESHLSSLSPRLPHQNFNMSSKVSRDSGCFDLIYQDIEIKSILTYILRKNYIDIIACIGTLYLRTLRRSYLRKR